VKALSFSALLFALALYSVGDVTAQESRIVHVGYLRAAPPDPLIDVFREAMRELGYVEGRNPSIIERYAYGEYGRLPGLAAELVRLKVDVIVTASTPATLAAKKASTSIPIVVALSGDPGGSGLVSSTANIFQRRDELLE
jgi:putative ABC transport system substrate-binding protein